VWSNELKYLGITILSSMNFKINMQPSGQTFVGVLIGINGKTHGAENFSPSSCFTYQQF